MSKKKSKKPTVGKNISNPFEQFNHQKRTKEFNFNKNNKNKSRFIKKFKDSELFYDHSSKKSKKLQLYNLNEDSFLTHKNKPIEDNYDSDIEHSSDEDLDHRGDFSNISETYKEYKDKRVLSRKDKEEQKNLLSKLDKEFEELDFSEFYKPAKNSLEYFKSQENNRKLDEYESNLKDLQLNRNLSDPTTLLAKEYKSKSNISERCEVVKKILKSDSNFSNFAEEYVNGYLESLGNYLKAEEVKKVKVDGEVNKEKDKEEKEGQGEHEQRENKEKDKDTSLFTNYLDIFSRGFIHLSNKNYKEYKLYLEEQLLKADSESGDLNKYLLVFLVVKTVEPKTELHKYTLLLVERYLKELYEELTKEQDSLVDKSTYTDKEGNSYNTTDRSNKDNKDNRNKKKVNEIKLLLVIAYNLIVESEYYIGYFYHLSVNACTNIDVDVDLVLVILKAVKITLNVLLKNNCNISSTLSLIILPSLSNIENKFEKYKLDLLVDKSNYTDKNTNTLDYNKESKEDKDNNNREETERREDNRSNRVDKFREFVEFKEYIYSLARIKYPLKSLDIYTTQKLKVEYPKLKSNKDKKDNKNKFEKGRKGDKYSKKGDKSDRAEYKNLKRLLLNESLRRAEYNSQKKAKQRLDTEKRYKEVVRNAMIEQEMLKKLSTSSIYICKIINN